MNSTDFQPGQIVSLEYNHRRLYAEVIQVVVSRQLCWVRPLLLANYCGEIPEVTDLRDAADLILTINFFRPALDTEVIGLLSEIQSLSKLNTDTGARFQLNQFIHEVWQAYKI
ncbi:hypothetical protein [Iningainema tapete]|uniref:Uncharacterized protein n=1 Tax=Iningainema tapete BLCC-T55 TaxID=2748662 RepID=A0A8J7C8P2_9CYAN|nr:hypothetical protein [Iningainema tapete]MBD2774931.1 hypothetical protein [Iningainema tapete BLCC-T55]